MDFLEKRNILMSHYNNPYHKIKNTDSTYKKVNTSNSSCIDNLDIYVKIEDEIIKDITFDGEACSISISSTSIMIKNLIGKTINEAINYLNNFEAMLKEEKYDKNILDEALALEDTKNTSRKTCAMLPYIGIRKILEDRL